MAAKKQYWLITQRARKRGEPEADATYFMIAIDRSPVAWVEEVMADDGGYDRVLINQLPITAAEFKRLEGNVL